MRYNLTPFYDLLDETVPSRETWHTRLKMFFDNPHSNKSLTDLYYNVLLNNYHTLKPMLDCGYLIDEYSGIFSFNTPEMRGAHTFNMANFIRRNYMFFNDKPIRTLTMDYGVLNIQIKQCGLNFSGTKMPVYSIPGAALLTIGNGCAPYPFETEQEPQVIFACNIFNTEDEAWENWNTLFDAHIFGKDVFFCSANFSELKKFVNYDRIKQMETPSEIYDPELYSNGDLGYMTRIYRII